MLGNKKEYQALYDGLEEWFALEEVLGHLSSVGAEGKGDAARSRSRSSSWPIAVTQGAVLHVNPQGQVVTPRGYRGTEADAQPAIPLPGPPQGRGGTPCWFHFSGGGCKMRGAGCPYSHTDGEVVTQAPQIIMQKGQSTPPARPPEGSAGSLGPGTGISSSGPSGIVMGRGT